jgi:cobalt-zinc-cadmium resistance protein CzcA
VVLARVRAAIDGINARLEPDGAKVDPFYDRTNLVNTTLHTVGHNLLEGAILVTLVLFVFLLDLRAALVVGVLIPLSLLTSFIYLKMRGMSANLLSMGAVDFGVIVDGGVVIIESILARLSDERRRGETPMERIALATKAVVRPTVFALLIIIAAYLPIFMLQRVEAASSPRWRTRW